MIDKNEIKPIFIFSLPRSGSTLLQRIIATNQDVSTTSEPWVLLPFLYGLKEEGVYAEYSHFCVYNALQDLCREMPNGENDYLKAVRSAMLQIYKSISKENAKYFLDKTPRYALVVDKVIKTFPEGKIIFLWRNPIAVIASMLDSASPKKWNLFHYKADLYTGMENLIHAYEKNKTNALSLRYEDLVMNPENSLSKLELFLDLKYDKSKLNAFTAINLNGCMGDPTGVVKYRSISTDSLDRWKSIISNPWRKFWCKRYLKWLGKERLLLMGYELDRLLAEIKAVPTQWHAFIPDLIYSIYGLFYCIFELKIFKDKIKIILKQKLIKKHD